MVHLDYAWRPVVGGVIVSFGCSMFLLLKGRVTGFSGIIFGAITLNDFIWKLCVIIGMFWISNLFYIFSSDPTYFDSHESYLSDLCFGGFAVSGILVGLGTKLANGCTSGHGLCGLSRLSPRSIVSVIIFLGFAFGACTLRSNYNFLATPTFIPNSIAIDTPNLHYVVIGVFSALILTLCIIFLIKKDYVTFVDVVISFLIGVIMGLGFIIAGMNRRTIVRGFLNLNGETWDPTLLILLGVGVSLNFIFYFIFIRKREKPLFADKMELPTNTKIDLPLVIGSALFGVGWGWSCICPGLALVDLFMYIPHVLIFLVCIAVGQIIIHFIMKCINKKKKVQEEAKPETELEYIKPSPYIGSI